MTKNKINSGLLDNVCLCPRCGYKMDSFTGAEPDAITPNHLDVAVCLNCSAVLQYHFDNLTTPPHVRLLEAEPEAVADCCLEISRLQNAIKRVRAKNE